MIFYKQHSYFHHTPFSIVTLEPEGSPGGSVPPHLLVSRWAVLQPEECCGRDRGGGKGSEEDWQQAHADTLQV